MDLAIGTQIRWKSAAGTKQGTIKRIVLAPTADGKVSPWIDIELPHGPVARHHQRNYIVHLCATDANLKMMQVELVA